jgi:capsid protein
MAERGSEKDAGANLMEVRSGRKTWSQLVVEAGLDPEKQMAEIIAANKAFDAAGVVLDIDPRAVDRQRGAFQVKQTEAVSGKEN